MAHVFFQEFGISPQQGMDIPLNPTFQHNLMVLEIANNWPFVGWLMDRFRNRELQQVDPLEKDWLDFLSSNQINIENYGKDSDKFIEDFLKPIENKK
jgi:hypothetical protein